MEDSDFDSVLVRFGEIGSKTGYVRNEMEEVLRARVEERLNSIDAGFSKVSRNNGRIIVREVSSNCFDIAESVSMIPGVASASPCVNCSSEKKDFFSVAKDFNIGESFGVRCNVSGSSISGSSVERELGSILLEENPGSSVDLDSPDTWVRIDVRNGEAFVFNQVFEGVDGLPVGSQEKVGVLLSGGIDSPVAAFLSMKRGCNIHPIYVYNKPIAAEDHKLRFESVLECLKKFHPGQDWSYTLVDFEEINRHLMNEVDRGRMVVHRVLMFRVAEKICRDKGLSGLVTGESIGQKSSQTISNLDFTSSKIDLSVFRPLIGFNKNEIIDLAKDIGTFELSTVDSACRSLSPDKPLTKSAEYEFEEFSKDRSVEELAEAAFRESEEKSI